MQDKIIAAISAYLEKETVIATKLVGGETTRHFMSNPAKLCQEIAAEIAAAIAPLAEAKDYPYPELFDHMANEHGLTLTNTELGDIIHVARKDAPLVEAGDNNEWKNAPEWANYIAMDANGYWWWYSEKPQLSRGIWAFGGERMRKSLHKQDVAWYESLQERPK